jgi:4-hydroxybenzoate polyprenyltransferase
MQHVISGKGVAGYSIKLTWPLFWLLSVSSVLIAAAGYIINDYFDLNIDQVNKPEAIIVQKIIKRRWAIVWHLSLSAIGVVLAFYVGFKIGNLIVGLANFFCVLLLWFYSTTFKKRFLIGNIIISLLTAWVILVLYFSEVRVMFWKWDNGFREIYQHKISQLFKYAIVYAGFAFIISLIREVIKDIEDIKGDEKYGCRTMPIVLGIPATKVFTGVWLLVLSAAIIIVQVYAFIKGWWLGSIHCFIFILLPLYWLLKQFYHAQSVTDYHKLSSVVKLVMLTGILSMFFFKIYL